MHRIRAHIVKKWKYHWIANCMLTRFRIDLRRTTSHFCSNLRFISSFKMHTNTILDFHLFRIELLKLWRQEEFFLELIPWKQICPTVHYSPYIITYYNTFQHIREYIETNNLLSTGEYVCVCVVRVSPAQRPAPNIIKQLIESWNNIIIHNRLS